MRLIKKETMYTYELSELERLSLIGILSTLNKYGEISGLDDPSKETVSSLLKVFER